MRLEHISILVDDYDAAIDFYTKVLGFDLIEDAPMLTKRWVVVRPPGAETGLVLAQASNDEQAQAVGRQVGDRVGFFLRVEDFQAAYDRMAEAGVEFLEQPRSEPYGQVVVFFDIAGNRWDLLGPPFDSARFGRRDAVQQ